MTTLECCRPADGSPFPNTGTESPAGAYRRTSGPPTYLRPRAHSALCRCPHNRRYTGDPVDDRRWVALWAVAGA
jgi:hypothetical protein